MSLISSLPNRPPVVAAWGMGVDSTAMIIELVARGEAPDVVLTADTGAENPLTYEFLPVFQRWMDAHGVEHHVVRYQPKRFKHWPPYRTILENILTNATLPSISMGGPRRGSCSSKWKREPQDKWVAGWAPAQAAWAAGRRVTKLIGYDISPADTRRSLHANTLDDPLYDFVYPLREWEWDRARCEERIRQAGLPVPPKSSCFICLAMRPEEIMALPPWCLRLIVLVEARAKPRLRTVEGIWKSSTRTRPGMVTDFIRAKHLLDPAEIDDIVANAPLDLVRFQEVAALIPIEDRPEMREWLDSFNAGITALAA